MSRLRDLIDADDSSGTTTDGYQNRADEQDDETEANTEVVKRDPFSHYQSGADLFNTDPTTIDEETTDYVNTDRMEDLANEVPEPETDEVDTSVYTDGSYGYTPSSASDDDGDDGGDGVLGGKWTLGDNPLTRAGQGTADVTGDVTGWTEYKNSEDYDRRQDAYDDTDTLGKLDQGFRMVSDFTLDNPNASVQDTTRVGLREAMEAGYNATHEGNTQLTDEDVGAGFQQAATATKDAWDGATPDSTALKWGGAVADAFVASPIKGGFAGATGVDVDTGSTEGTLGAVDAFEIGTFGAGTAVTGGTKGAGLLGRLLSRGGDDVAKAGDEASALVPAGEDAATFGVRTDDAAAGVDDVANAGDDVPALVGKGEDASTFGARTVDETAGATDDAVREAFEEGSGFGARVTSRGSDDAAEAAARGGDEAAETTAKAADDAPTSATDDAVREGVENADDASRTIRERVTDLFSRGSDDAAEAAAKGGDDVAGGADDAAGPLSRFFSNSGVKFGAGAIGAGAAAGAGYDWMEGQDEVTAEDDEGNQYLLSNAGGMEPTEEHPNGGTLWHVQKNGASMGYTVVVDVQGRNVIILGGNGDHIRAKASMEDFNNAAGGNAGGL